MARKILLVVASLAILFSPPAMADQYSYVTLRQATQALDVLARNQEFMHFCVPCARGTDVDKLRNLAKLACRMASHAS